MDQEVHRPYARAHRGKRVYADISGKFRSRTTVIAGYVKGGFIAPFCFKGHTNTLVFNTWVEKVLLPDLKPGQVVVLDNATFHKSKRTTELIESAGCRVIFLPPYSPDLNKIEPMWANLKRKIRNLYDSSLSFNDNIDCQFKAMCKL